MEDPTSNLIICNTCTELLFILQNLHNLRYTSFKQRGKDTDRQLARQTLLRSSQKSRFLKTSKNVNEHAYCSTRMFDCINRSWKKLISWKGNERCLPWFCTKWQPMFLQQSLLLFGQLIYLTFRVQSSFRALFLPTRNILLNFHLCHLNFWFPRVGYLHRHIFSLNSHIPPHTKPLSAIYEDSIPCLGETNQQLPWAKLLHKNIRMLK